MSEIKLSYFNSRGRAETSRLILAHAGVRYTDQRLTCMSFTSSEFIIFDFVYIAEQFASVKPRLPFGQLPTLKYEGELLCQSMTLAR